MGPLPSLIQMGEVDEEAKDDEMDAQTAPASTDPLGVHANAPPVADRATTATTTAAAGDSEAESAMISGFDYISSPLGRW